MNEQELAKLANEMARRAQAVGCKAIIVALATEVDGHNNFYVTHLGPCLTVEGLGRRVLSVVRKIWKNARRL